MSGLFYVLEVHLALLYGLEAGVMYPYIGKMMGGFHDRVAHILTGWNLDRSMDGT